MTSSPDSAGRPARILIVDDERQNRQLLEAMLAPEGFRLVSAASGEEALALVAQEPPDLILLDIMMPGMNGYQVAGKLKGGRFRLHRHHSRKRTGDGISSSDHRHDRACDGGG